MIKRQSLAKNYIFQFLYQAIILIIPLILSPYLTRTLLSSGNGVYLYVNSIAYYFVMFANLGIGVHGKRIISQKSSDETELRKSFWSLFILHTIISLLSLVAYIGFIVFFVKEDISIYVIEILYVLSALFDITWLFYGLENFQSVVVKNTVVKLLECSLVFIFVHSPEDLWKYTLIASGAVLLGQVIMIPQAVRIVKPISVHFEDIKRHIKPLLVFSVALIASSLYTVFDKTLIGILATKSDVAYYEFSNRIVSVPRVFVEIVSSVMFPRACKLALEGKLEEQRKYVNYSFFVTSFIGVGSFFALLAISELFASIYFGQEFASCGRIMIFLSPLVYIIGAGKILRSQCLIPNGMDKQFNLCIVINAVINLSLNLLLIPPMGIYGAIIGSISAELFGFFYQFYWARNFVSIKGVLTSFVTFSVIGAIMFFVIKIVAIYVDSNINGLIIQIVVGFTIYCGLFCLYSYLFKRADISEMLVMIKKQE